MRFVLIEETQEQNQAVYHHAIEDLCAGESFCYILFWSDAELVPTSMPMTDAQVAGQKASYSFNKSTGHRKLLWSCEIVNDPTQCFTPEFD